MLDDITVSRRHAVDRAHRRGVRRHRRRLAERHLRQPGAHRASRPAPRRRAAGRQVPPRALRARRWLRRDAAHLSIGEVLGLLLEEFPDVTISKIRFLESQGLIEPERTPSGYRKFFDDDVELLRVILREQREKFLPLRVIKDRIELGRDRDERRHAGRAAPSPAEQPTPGAGRQAPGRRGGAARVSRPSRRLAAERETQAAAAPAAARRARQPRRAVRDGVGDAGPARRARGLRRGQPARRGRRAVRRGRRRDRRRRRRVPARRRRRPPPAGVADVGRAGGRAVRAADPAGAAPAQPAGAAAGGDAARRARRPRRAAARGDDAGDAPPVPRR